MNDQTKNEGTYQHTLLHYLEGKLSSDERYNVEQTLLRSPAAKSALESLQNSGLSTNELQTDLQEIRTNWHSSTHTVATSPSQWWSKVAAVAVLLIMAWAAWGYYQYQKPASLYANYFADSEQQEAYQAVRGKTSTLPGLAPALEAYQQQDYQQSYAQFQQLREDHPFSGLVLRYTAMSAMQLGDFYAAEQALQQSLSIENTSTERAAARWYLALVYLRMGQEAPAKEQLQHLTEAGDGMYASQANKLLGELED